MSLSNESTMMITSKEIMNRIFFVMLDKIAKLSNVPVQLLTTKRQLSMPGI
jgi:hypothetical protein